jgi:hypothetical protein
MAPINERASFVAAASKAQALKAPPKAPVVCSAQPPADFVVAARPGYEPLKYKCVLLHCAACERVCV